ncbi:hypothetical protein JCM6882_006770 [Rhodosporidiobolus microsporus]
MPCQPNELTYKKLYKCWPPGPTLSVSFAPGNLDLLIVLPLDFTKFRLELCCRDGMDYFTRLSGQACVPAHLLYKALTGEEYQYDVSYGLFMEPMLHKAYDDYLWSIYHHNDRYYFHAFDATSPAIRDHHGKSFGPRDMRVLDPPDVNLCNWHYTQCVLKFVRGYSVRMAVSAY